MTYQKDTFNPKKLILGCLMLGVVIGGFIGCEAGEYMQKTMDNSKEIETIKREQF